MNYNNKYIYDIRVTFDVNVSRKKHAISFAKSNPIGTRWFEHSLDYRNGNRFRLRFRIHIDRCNSLLLGSHACVELLRKWSSDGPAHLICSLLAEKAKSRQLVYIYEIILISTVLHIYLHILYIENFVIASHWWYWYRVKCKP